ncbi:MAG: hypothetical protein NW223_08475 [Hyphomicrobiaceae bacterium]|nr:hypothetical protein [Hyphomicrobiaceae bacterium]
MTAARAPLDRQSILLVADDVLGAFRLRQHLAAAGARVIMGDARETIPYLAAPALAAVVVAADVNATDRAALVAELTLCDAPWVAYGSGAQTADLAGAAARLGPDPALLVETLAALLAPARH